MEGCWSVGLLEAHCRQGVPRGKAEAALMQPEQEAPELGAVAAGGQQGSQLLRHPAQTLPARDRMSWIWLWRPGQDWSLSARHAVPCVIFSVGTGAVWTGSRGPAGTRPLTGVNTRMCPASVIHPTVSSVFTLKPKKPGRTSGSPLGPREWMDREGSSGAQLSPWAGQRSHAATPRQTPKQQEFDA